MTMDKLWEKAVTNAGIPYYIDHLTERTQWDHPDFAKALQILDGMGDIQFASYRAAVKLRMLQKVLNLDFVELSDIDSAFDHFGFRRRRSDSSLGVAQLHSIIHEMFSGMSTGRRNCSPTDADTCADLLLNWVLNLYDKGRTGCLRVSSAKICIAALCASRLTEKYQYFYRHLSDRADGISRRKMIAFLQDLIRISELINESSTLGRNASAAVNSCFATVIGTTVSQDRYMNWLLAEPQTIVWLPTMHRLAAAESMRHEAKCNICKMAPISGLRFKCLKCLNYDMCQECFFIGATTKRHRLTHPTQEYVQGMSSREDIRAFAKTIRNKLSKKHGRRIKLNYLPIDDLDTDIYAYSDPASHKADMHARLGHISKKLAAVEDMKPWLPPPAKVAPSPDTWTHQPKTPSPDTGRGSALSQGTSSNRSRERRHLEDLIDTLERENEELVSDIEQLVRRQMAASQVDGPHVVVRNNGEDYYSEASDDEGDSDADGEMMMQAKQEVLEEQNKQLEMQLRTLKDLLKQNRTPPKASASMYIPNHAASPPPYHSPPTRVLLDQTAPAHLPSYQGGVDEIDDGHLNLVVSAMRNDATPHQSAAADRVRPPDMTNQSAASKAVNESYGLRPPVTVYRSASSEAVIDNGTPHPSFAVDQSATAPVSYQSQQANPTMTLSLSDSTVPLPSHHHSQSAVTPGTFASRRLLPAHLADQSTVMFPNLSASRMFPPEESEMNKILQRFNEVYPLNTQDERLSPELSRPSTYAPAPTFMRTRRPQGTHDNPRDMIDAVARIGDAMTTLVARVTDRPSGM